MSITSEPRSGTAGCDERADVSHVQAGQNDVAAMSRGVTPAGPAHQREASAGWDDPADSHAVGTGQRAAISLVRAGQASGSWPGIRR
jgi:hypothetical protein